MFDAGVTELLLIMVIALLVVGPERLPGLARNVGLWIGRARSYFNSVRSDIARELRADELKQMLNQQQEEIQRLKTMVEDTGQELEQDFKETEQLLSEENAASESSSQAAPPASEVEAAPASEPETMPIRDDSDSQDTPAPLDDTDEPRR